jgi:hypothetical protein
MRALGAAGVTPLKASLGAVVGGGAVGAVGSVLALLPAVDLAPLFPRVVSSGTTWVPQGGAWLDLSRGVVVQSTGELAAAALPARAALLEAPAPRLATAVALFVAAIGFPLWATAQSEAFRRSAVALGVAALSVAVFHLVAAERIPAVTLVLPPALLLLDALALHRRPSWR